MVDHHDHDNKALTAFNQLWESKFAKDSLLVFSTGRSHALYTDLRKEVPLGNPDVLVCSVGTEIFFEATGASPEANQEWKTELDQGWNRQEAIDAAAKFSELKAQDASEQRPHKLSYHLSAKGEDAQNVISQLQEALKAAGVRAKIIYSGGMDVDILPEGASKGEGLKFLLRQIKEAGNEQKDGVMVCGDSGNDVELFAVPGVRGCMVVNAHQELKQWCDAHPSPDLFQATQRCAGGIVEALQHFKLVPQN
ncbi:g2832 [Coccomyxa viridis]|uniref:Sucrose-phosphatase n=1 Tax=Coccomyxa viridis TaxID=1274662 RepID=A0ABP1FRK2_9CHLO